MRAIQVTEFGGPEVLRLVDLPMPEPGDGEVLVRVSRAGINYADTHQRQNTYLAAAQLPLVPGIEVAGVREDTGERVVAMCGTGGYAEFAVAPAALTVPIPDGVEDGTALALVLQGLTAWHLYRTSARVQEGESVVVHAAAGGVGSLAVQLGKAMGAGRVIATASSEEKRTLALELGALTAWHLYRTSARVQEGETVVVHAAAGGVGSLAVQLGRAMGAGRVIATASSEEKRALALELGADAAVDAAPEGMAERLIEANGGRRVDVVFEMAGGEVFEQSLSALAPFGRVIAYGNASGEANTVATGRLMRRSAAVVGFWLMHLVGRPEMVAEPLADLFARAARGDLRAVVGATYPLAEAAQAHTDMQARRTTGKLLLDPTAA